MSRAECVALKRGVDLDTESGAATWLQRLIEATLQGKVAPHIARTAGGLASIRRSLIAGASADRREKAARLAADEILSARTAEANLRDVGPPPDSDFEPVEDTAST